MNEFTKEELVIINYCFENISQRKFTEDEKIQPVYLKIRKMIESYCEHEWHPGGNRPWLHCIKCKSNFNHEPYQY